MSLAPIILFTYNRLWHTKETVNSILQNPEAKETDLIIYSDAAKKEADQDKVYELRTYLKTISGFASVRIIEQEENRGLSSSILSGVSEVLQKHDRIIVLEDDLRCSPFFLKYMNEGLSKYEDESKVACVHAYCYPIEEQSSSFFLRGSDCWGWGTWRRAWDEFETDGRVLLNQLQAKGLANEFDFNGAYPYTKMLKDQIEGKNDSWAVRWKASTFLHNQLCLYYKRSLVQNIGNDSSGTHSQSTDQFYVELPERYEGISDIPISEDKKSRLAFEQFYRSIQPSLLKRINAKLKAVWK